jgi:hypothetical protein
MVNNGIREFSMSLARRDPGMDIDTQGLMKEGRGVKLLVEGIPRFLTHQQLYALFLPFGTVVGAHIALPAIGDSQGFGYVYMKTLTDANKACDVFKGMATDRVFACVQIVEDETVCRR